MPNYFHIPTWITKLWVGHERVSAVYAQNLSVNCDLDLATWFLFATHCLAMMIICAKLFLNPTMHYKVMGRTRTGLIEVLRQSLSANCDLDL